MYEFDVSEQYESRITNSVSPPSPSIRNSRIRCNDYNGFADPVAPIRYYLLISINLSISLTKPKTMIVSDSISTVSEFGTPRI